MRKLATIGLFVLLMTAGAQEAFSGAWQGAIQIPGSELSINVVFTLEDDTLTGSADIPAQGASGIPLGNISAEGDSIRFSLAGVPGNPTFDGTLQDDTISGTFAQGGASFPFVLERTTTEALQEDRFSDPEGFFSVPIPTNWTAEVRDGYNVLLSPNEGITVYLLTLEGDDIEAAITEAWAQVDEAFDLEVRQTLTPPSQPGVEATVVVNYDTEPSRIVQAVGQRYEGRIYLLLVDAELVAAQQRGSQIMIINSGYRIEGIEEDDLSGLEPRSLDDSLLAEFEAYIGDALSRYGVPGLVVAVVQDGEVVYTGGFGVRELGSEEPMTPDTLVMTGSTGKTFTTMLMATLVDDGLMMWETPAVEVLPEFRVADPEMTQGLTLQNLVCACTGVPRRDFELIFNADSLTAEDIVRSLATFEFFTDFGEAFQYSNQMVGTGGYAAAAADGAEFGNLFEGYAESLQRRVFAPIGMQNSFARFEDALAVENRATPHGRALENRFVTLDPQDERVLAPIMPAGAHWSTIEDMGRYLVTQLAFGVAPDGERVVSEENLRRTWEPQVPVSAETSYGLGWFVGEYKGLTLIDHGGNTLGFTSDFAFLPEVGVGISVITNGSGTNALNAAIRTRLFELLYDLEPEADAQLSFNITVEAQNIEEAQADLGELDVDAVEVFLGHYRNPALGELELRLEDTRLIVDVGELQADLLPYLRRGEVDHYVSVTPPLLGAEFRLVLEEDAPVVVFGEGVVEYRFTRE